MCMGRWYSAATRVLYNTDFVRVIGFGSEKTFFVHSHVIYRRANAFCMSWRELTSRVDEWTLDIYLTLLYAASQVDRRR